MSSLPFDLSRLHPRKINWRKTSTLVGNQDRNPSVRKISIHALIFFKPSLPLSLKGAKLTNLPLFFLRALELEYRNWTTGFSSSDGSLRWRLPATCNKIECSPSCPNTVTGFLRFLLCFGCRFNSTEILTYSCSFLHLQVYLEVKVMIPSLQLSVHWLRSWPGTKTSRKGK